MGFRKVRDNEWEEGKKSSGLDWADEGSRVCVVTKTSKGAWEASDRNGVRRVWRPDLGWERAQCIGLKGESGGAGGGGGVQSEGTSPWQTYLELALHLATPISLRSVFCSAFITSGNADLVHAWALSRVLESSRKHCPGTVLLVGTCFTCLGLQNYRPLSAEVKQWIISKKAKQILLPILWMPLPKSKVIYLAMDFDSTKQSKKFSF